MAENPLFAIRQLTLRDRVSGLTLLDEIDLSVGENQCVAIVGESGSGKSLLCKSALGLLPSTFAVEGSIHFDGRPLTYATAQQRAAVCGTEIGLIVQDAMSAFDPLYTIGAQFFETLHYRTELNKADIALRTAETLRQAQFSAPEEILKKYPHQLSGGMLQRAMIALTLSLRPKLIIADEPTASLDCITQYEIIRQFIQLRAESRCALLFVSHDLAVVRELAQYIVVMKSGKIIERGDVDTIFNAPQHEFTRRLIATRCALSEKFRRATQGVKRVA